MLKVMDINLLKAHEEVDKNHVQEIKEALLKDGVQIEPILVENKYNIILDGHHRVEALKDLGYSKVVVYFVDYENVNLESWNPNTKIEKEDVITKALRQEKFPPRTTKHTLSEKVKNASVKLIQLK